MDDRVRFDEDYGYSSRLSPEQSSGGLVGFTVKASGGILSSGRKIIIFWAIISFMFFYVAYSVVRNTVEGSGFINEDVLRELSPPEYYLSKQNVKQK